MKIVFYDFQGVIKELFTSFDYKPAPGIIYINDERYEVMYMLDEVSYGGTYGRQIARSIRVQKIKPTDDNQQEELPAPI